MEIEKITLADCHFPEFQKWVDENIKNDETACLNLLEDMLENNLTRDLGKVLYEKEVPFKFDYGNYNDYDSNNYNILDFDEKFSFIKDILFVNAKNILKCLNLFKKSSNYISITANDLIKIILLKNDYILKMCINHFGNSLGRKLFNSDFDTEQYLIPYIKNKDLDIRRFVLDCISFENLHLFIGEKDITLLFQLGRTLSSFVFSNTELLKTDKDKILNIVNYLSSINNQDISNTILRLRDYLGFDMSNIKNKITPYNENAAKANIAFSNIEKQFRNAKNDDDLLQVLNSLLLAFSENSIYSSVESDKLIARIFDKGGEEFFYKLLTQNYINLQPKHIINTTKFKTVAKYLLLNNINLIKKPNHYIFDYVIRPIMFELSVDEKFIIFNNFIKKFSLNNNNPDLKSYINNNLIEDIDSKTLIKYLNNKEYSIWVFECLLSKKNITQNDLIEIYSKLNTNIQLEIFNKTNIAQSTELFIYMQLNCVSKKPISYAGKINDNNKRNLFIILKIIMSIYNNEDLNNIYKTIYDSFGDNALSGYAFKADILNKAIIYLSRFNEDISFYKITTKNEVVNKYIFISNCKNKDVLLKIYEYEKLNKSSTIEFLNFIKARFYDDNSSANNFENKFISAVEHLDDIFEQIKHNYNKKINQQRSNPAKYYKDIPF